MDVTLAKKRAAEQMPALLDKHAELVGIPSIAFPGFPSDPVVRMARAVQQLFTDVGVDDVRLLDIEGGYPAVYADIPGPAGAPTVLLYAHYDVQPAPPEQGWTSEPFTATTKEDGRIYGRGAADDKSGLIIHAGTLGALRGKLPVGVRLLIEGEEETISHLDEFVETHPDLVQCDAAIIADMGPQSVGRPALTTGLRGDVSCLITVRTLANPVHSGLFGGAAPDALVALIKILATLHDDAGNTAVPGVTVSHWPGADMDEQTYRDGSAILPGVEYYGEGSLSDRVWAKPSVTVIGLDAPRTAEAANILIPEATAKVSMRIVPGADGERELAALVDHLKAQRPWGCQVEVEPVKVGQPFAVDTSAPAIEVAGKAMADVYGRDVEFLGSGGSIPLLASIEKAVPGVPIVLWGAEDMEKSRIHASDESVDPAEMERMIATQVLALSRLGGEAND